jgi:hypothetical protein
MIIPKSITSDKYPPFIRKNKFFKRSSIPLKNFEELGLANTFAKVKATAFSNIENATAFKHKIAWHISNAAAQISKLSYTHDKYRYWLFSSPEAANLDRDAVVKLLLELAKKIEDSTIVTKKDLSVKLIDSFYATLNEAANASEKHLTEATLAKMLNFCVNQKSLYQYWELPNEDMKVVFSSKGSQANWDMATMSMRGITSCQRWNHSMAKHLIGSIVDPNAAILYLTNGDDTKYGSKMIRRSVVRLVVDNKTQEKVLLMERIYPFLTRSNFTDPSTLKVFKNFLTKKTKGKIKIVYALDKSFNSKRYSIPMAQELKLLKSSEQSYIDSKVQYL